MRQKMLCKMIAKETRQKTPAQWDFDSWIRMQHNFILTNEGSKEGNRCLKFVATKQVPDDITYFQRIAVKQNTRYLLSGWSKTENVVVEETGCMVGASFAFASARWNGLKPNAILGASDWTYKTLVFDSKNDDSVTVAARTGFSNSTLSGVAWFDDLCLGELPDQT